MQLTLHLLQLVESVNLIYEEDGPPLEHGPVVLGQLDRLLHVVHPRGGG